MKRHNDEHISKILNKIQQKPKLKQGFVEEKIRIAWKEEMGTAVAQLTESIAVSKNTLILKLNSSILRNEYHQNMDKLLIKINEIVGESYFEKIILR